MAKNTEMKVTLRIKKLPTTPDGTAVLDWLNQNPGSFPGKVTMKAAVGGKTAHAIVDDKPIGIIQGNDGRPYPCSEFNFDDKGICVDDYTMTITGLVPGVPNTMSVTVVKNIIEVKTEVAGDATKFEAEVQRIIDNKICTEEDIRKKLEVMLQNQCTDKVIFRVLRAHTQFNPYCRRPKSLYCSVKNDGHMQEALMNAMTRFAMVYSGGQSVGKNVMAETVAWLLNMQYYLITFSQDMTSDDVFGGKSTDNTASKMLTMELAKKALEGDKEAAVSYDLYKAKAASVQIIMDESAFCEWLQHGGVMCFNEMNLIEANLFASFANQIADGTGFIFIPGRGRIDVNPDCVLVGTQNPGFEGTLTQNQATMSRFGLEDFGYPAEIVGPLKAALSDIVDEVPGVMFNQVNKLYMEFLASHKSGEISDACLNIRGFARAIRNAVEWDASLAREISVHVVNTCGNEDKAVLAQKVSLHFE